MDKISNHVILSAAYTHITITHIYLLINSQGYLALIIWRKSFSLSASYLRSKAVRYIFSSSVNSNVPSRTEAMLSRYSPTFALYSASAKEYSSL